MNLPMFFLTAALASAAPPAPAALGGGADPAPCPADGGTPGDANPAAHNSQGATAEDEGGSGGLPSLEQKKDNGEGALSMGPPKSCPLTRPGKGRPNKQPWKFRQTCNEEKLAKAEQCKDDPPEPPAKAAAGAAGPGGKGSPCAPKKESQFQKCTAEALKGACDSSIEKEIAASAKGGSGGGKSDKGSGKSDKGGGAAARAEAPGGASGVKNSSELRDQNKLRRDFAKAAENFACDLAAQWEAASDATYALEQGGIIEPVEVEQDLGGIFKSRSIFKSGSGDNGKKPESKSGGGGGEDTVLKHLSVKDLDKGFQPTAESAPMLAKILIDGGGKGRYKLGEEVAPLFAAAQSLDDAIKAVLEAEGTGKTGKKKTPKDAKGESEGGGKEYSLDEYRKAADALAKIQWDGCFELKKKHDEAPKDAGAQAPEKKKAKGPEKDAKKKKETLHELDDALGEVAWDSFCEPAVVVSKLMKMLAKRGLSVRQAQENMSDAASINASGRTTQLTGHEGDVLKKYGKGAGGNLSGAELGETYDGSTERAGDIGNPGAPSDTSSRITENDNASPTMLREQGPAPLGTTKAGPSGGSGITAKGSGGSGGGLWNWLSSWLGESATEQTEAEAAAAAASRSAGRK